MDSGSSRLLVVPSPGGGWHLRETPGGPVLGGAGSKQEIVTRAGLMLERGRGGRIVLLGPEGAVQRTLVVEPAGARPWWYVRPGLTRWLVLLFLASQVARAALGWGNGPASVVLGVVALALGLVAAVAVRRSVLLDRARAPVEVDPT